MIREIDSSDWPALCQRITQQRAGATVTMEAIETGAAKGGRIDGAYFESLLFDKSNPCNDVITLRLRNDREIIHQIIEPIHIRLRPSGVNGDFNPLQIEAESGTTIITLHPAIHTQLLEGLRIS